MTRVIKYRYLQGVIISFD